MEEVGCYQLQQRKKIGETKALSYRVPEGLHARLVEQARKEDRSINMLVLEAIERYLDFAEEEAERR